MRWPVAWCLLAAMLFGASTPISKVLLDDCEPLTLAGLLYLGAALAVAPFARRGGSASRRSDRANLVRLAGAVFAGGVLGPALLLYGLRLAPAASVSLWLNLETIATALLAVALFREHLQPRVWLAVLGVLGAGVLLAAPDGFTLAPAGLLVAAGCLCWGLDNNLTAIIDGYTPEQTTLVKGAVAGAFNLVVGLSLGQSLPGVWTVLAALAVGALSYGASIVLYIRGAQHLGATRSQLLFATAPFLGVVMAWVGLGEPILAVQLVATAVLAVSLFVMLSAHHAHVHTHAPVTHTHLHRHDDAHHDHDHADVPPGAWHTHEHTHEGRTHSHPHDPDLHHRHDHQ